MAETVTIFLNTTAQTKGIRTTIHGLNQVKNNAMALDGWLKNIAIRMAAFAAGTIGVTVIARGLKDAVKQGIDFNAQLEDAQLGIAAILKQFNPQGFKTFADAMKASGDAIEALKKKAVESPASFGQLVAGFQAISGAATGSGIAIQDQVELVVLMSQALSGLGIQSNQLIQESRALITGNINENAAAAKILVITPEQIMLARQSGTVFEFLKEKLSAFAEAGKIGSRNFTTAVSNLGDVVEQKLAQLTIPIFNALREGVLELTQTIDKADLAKSFEEISQEIAGVASSLLKLAKFGVENIRAVNVAVDALSLAFGLLAVRITAALVPLTVRALAPSVAMFGAMNTVVKTVSISEGLILGAVAAMSSWASAIPVIAAGFAGWQLGKWLNDLDLLGKGLGEFGTTLGDRMTFNLLKFMVVWERLKMSLGIGGSLAQISALKASIQELSSPSKFGKPAASSLPGVPKSREQLLGEFDSQNRLNDLELKSLDIQERKLRVRGLEIIEINRAASLATGPLEMAELRARLEHRIVGSLSQEADGLRRIFDEQKKIIEARSVLNMKAALEGLIDPEEARQRELADLRDLLSLEEKRLALKEQTNDFTFFEKFQRNIQDAADATIHFGAAVADILSGAVLTSIDAVADGIWDVIDGTRTWGEIFQQVGRRIISQLIAIGIQELLLDNLKRGIVMAWSAFKTVFLAADVVKTNAAEAAKTPALATNATLASIGSWGLAVAIGLAAIAGVLVAVGSFEQGGVVGGGRQLVMVNENGTESILNARATAMLGERGIAALNSGVMDFQNGLAASLSPPSSGVSASGGSVGGGGGQPEVRISVILVDSRNAQAARDFALSSEGKAVIAEVVRNQKLEIGV